MPTGKINNVTDQEATPPLAGVVLFDFHDQKCDIVAQFSVSDKFKDVFRDAFGDLGRGHMFVLMQLPDQAFLRVLFFIGVSSLRSVRRYRKTAYRRFSV